MTATHVGAVRVVRTFRVSTDGRLLSTSTSGGSLDGTCGGFYVWQPGDNLAACPRGDHGGQVPAERCRCGFYGYADPGTLLRSDVPGSHDLMAVVALTGRVVPARRGARGQHARIEALWLSRRALAQGLAERIGARYPDAAAYSSRDAMLAEFPLTRLEGQRPRHGASVSMLALAVLYFLASWVLPVLDRAPSASGVDTIAPAWSRLGLGLAVTGTLAVPVLRRLPRAWWSSALLAPGLFAAAALTSGVPRLLLLMALLGASFAGLVWETGLFLVTAFAFGRGVSVLDLSSPVPRPVGPPDLRPDIRAAALRLLVVISSAICAGAIAQTMPAPQVPTMVGAYLLLVLTSAVVLEKFLRHRIALGLLGLAVLPPLLHDLGPLGAATTALAAAGFLLAVTCVYLSPARPRT